MAKKKMDPLQRAHIVSSIGQQGQSRAEKFFSVFLRDQLNLDPEAPVQPAFWDVDNLAETKTLTTSPTEEDSEAPGAKKLFKSRKSPVVDLKLTKVLTRGPKKDPDRIVEKMTDGVIERVGDTTRLKVIFNDAATIRTLRRLLPRFDQVHTDMTHEWAKKGVILTEYEDNYYKAKKHGYAGFHIKCDMMIGKGRWAKVELKFIFEHMRETDRVTHALFEEKRAITDAAASEGRKLTPEEQEEVTRDESLIKAFYERDMHNKKYGLTPLIGPAEEVAYFDSLLKDAKDSSGKKSRRAQRISEDKDYPINTPWHWEASNFNPEAA